MKTAHFLPLFLAFSLFACGSNAANTERATENDVPTSTTAQTAASTTQSASNVASPNDTQAPSPTPTPSVTPEPTPTLTPAPTPTPTQAAPSDPYVGTYAAVTLPLTQDKCQGSCAPTYDAVRFTVTHDAAGYHAGTIDATLQSNGGLEWQLTQPGVLSTCSDVLITQGGELAFAPDGRLAEAYSTLTTGTCNGGVRSSCECMYIDYVPVLVNP